MDEIEAKKKWDDFLDWINSNSTNSYYRGESNNEYLLRPKVGRKNYSLSDELNMFEHFKRRANIYVNAKNDFEWLALAQHHGLPTRLLDWTLNPLVACFFAVTSNIGKTARIYVLDSKMNEPINLDRYNSPFEIDKIHILHPPISTRRIELQKGLFSIHPLPNKPLLIGTKAYGGSDVRKILIEVENNYHFNDFPKPIFNEETYDEEITKYLINFYQINSPYFEIPSNCKRYFEKRIRLLGVDETIFGDIDSIAKNIEYSKQNVELNEIVKSNFINVKPFLKHFIEEKIIDYFEKNDNFFKELKECKIFDRKMHFEIYDLAFNNNKVNGHYAIRGRLDFTIFPNINSSKEVRFISFDQNLENFILNINNILKVKIIAIPISINDIELQIEMFGQDFNEKHLKIHKVSVLKFEDQTKFENSIATEFSKFENQYNSLKNQIEEIDFENLHSNVLSNDEINLLSKKYDNLEFK